MRSELDRLQNALALAEQVPALLKEGGVRSSGDSNREAEAEAAEEEEQEEGFRVVGLAGEGAQKKEDDGDADALTTAARDVQQDAAPHSLARSVRSTRSAQPSRGVSIGTAEAAAGLSLLKRASIGWGEAPSPFTPTPYAARRRR